MEDKLDKQVLQKGMLLEFRKDSERVLLAVAQKPDGKKNWMVYDQVVLEISFRSAEYITSGAVVFLSCYLFIYFIFSVEESGCLIALKVFFSSYNVWKQNGVMSSIKPQQITYIVPGVNDFDQTEVMDFVQRAHNLLVSGVIST